MSMTEASQTSQDGYERGSRRTLLKRIGVLGAATTLAFGEMIRKAPKAEAAPLCCQLYYQNNCTSCFSGWHWEVWYCMYGNKRIGCGECVNNGINYCWTSSTISSCWWYA